jgi:hypothetical protein
MFLARRSDDRFNVSPQNPFNLDERSQPQPDLCLFDTAVDTLGHHPGPELIFLVIRGGGSPPCASIEKTNAPHSRENSVREFGLINLNDNVPGGVSRFRR